jgi:hypothetical protein
MKQVQSLGLTILVVATGYGASAAVITFDDLGLPPLGDVTTQYAAQGVTFQGFTDGGVPVNLEVADNGVFADNNPPSPPMSLSNFYNQDPFSRAHIMRIVFSGPADSISLMYNGAGGLGSSTLFDAYSPSSVLLGEFTVPSAVDSDFHLVSIPVSGVGYLDIVNPAPGWGHYIDNLSFEIVPEPATALVLGAGAIALMFRRRTYPQQTCEGDYEMQHSLKR